MEKSTEMLKQKFRDAKSSDFPGIKSDIQCAERSKKSHDTVDRAFSDDNNNVEEKICPKCGSGMVFRSDISHMNERIIRI